MPMHGGDGGSEGQFDVDSGDYIVGTSGRYGKKIDSLIIQTNNKYSERYGGGGDASYSYVLSPNLEIVGLLGRSGDEVDSIGAVFRQRT
jgi:hypothetical protein